MTHDPIIANLIFAVDMPKLYSWRPMSCCNSWGNAACEEEDDLFVAGAPTKCGPCSWLLWHRYSLCVHDCTYTFFELQRFKFHSNVFIIISETFKITSFTDMSWIKASETAQAAKSSLAQPRYVYLQFPIPFSISNSGTSSACDHLRRSSIVDSWLSNRPLSIVPFYDRIRQTE